MASEKSRRPASFETSVKNLFRQHFNQKNRIGLGSIRKRNSSYWREFQKIRQMINSDNANLLYKIVELNSHYPFDGLGSVFEFDRSSFIDSKINNLTPLQINNELILQVNRINHHKAKLISALISISEINNSLSNHEWSAAENLIKLHYEQFGYSLCVTKKDLLCTLGTGSLSALTYRVKELTKGCSNTAYALMVRMIYDFVDPTFDPTRATRHWINISTNKKTKNWYGKVIESVIFSCPITKERFSDLFLRLNATSLIDLCLCFWKSYKLRADWPEIRNAWLILDADIRSVLDEKFSTFQTSVPKPYIITALNVSDKEVYRQAFLFDEYANVCSWLGELQVIAQREHLEKLEFDFSWLNSRKVMGPIRSLRSDFEATLPILENTSTFTVSFLKVNAHIENHDYLFSLVVAEALREDVDNLSEKQFTTLLSSPIDLQSSISDKTISNLKNIRSCQDSALIQFILSDISFRKNRSGDNELERRLYFMEMFPSHAKENIVPYLDSMYLDQSSLAVHLVSLCNRRFLEKLFLMVSSVKDVIEVRIQLCEWLVLHDSKNQEDYREEKSALTRELGNLDAQSDLDSTRIHVDEDSLREWFLESHRASVLRYIQTVLAEGSNVSNESLLTFYARLKDQDEILNSTAIGSDIILLDIFQRTLEAFASDKMFGLDSYLSRRIRHGTLRGHLITPLDRACRLFEESAEASEGLSNGLSLAELRSGIAKWRSRFLEQIDDVRRNFIQVRSEKTPNGLIQATWRLVANVAYLDAMVGRARTRVLESNGDYDIFPDIYALCWDCLEPDLYQLRLYMTKNFLYESQAGLRKIWEDLSYEAQHLGGHLFAEMSSILNSRVREVCGWFIRPVFRRDSYSLRTLINTTYSTTKELDASFLFNEIVEMDSDIEINRGSFEVFWDVLFVLIGNAARHGQNNGFIKTACLLTPNDNHLVEVSVTSDLNDETPEFYINRIKDAFAISIQSDLDKAAVEEGFSGLRKLIGIIRRVNYPRVNLLFKHDPEANTVTFQAYLPTLVLLRWNHG